MKPKYFVIDGYNVLGAMGWPPDKVLQSEGKIVDEFLVELSAYAQRVHTSMTVIFDAWRQRGKTRQVQHRAGVTVMYSSEGERADHILQQILRKCGKDVGIVSSDHEVLQVAKAHGAFIMRSQEFVRKISATPRLPESRRSVGGQVAIKEEEHSISPRKEKKGNPKKLPKKMRQRNRIMGKF